MWEFSISIFGFSVEVAYSVRLELSLLLHLGPSGFTPTANRKLWGIPSLFPIFLLILFGTVLLCGAVRIEGEFLSLFSLSTEQLGFNLCKKTLVNTFFQKLRWLSLPKLLSQERCSASDFIVEYNCYLHELILLV